MEFGSSCLVMGTGIEFEGFEDAVFFLPLVASAVGIDNLVMIVGGVVGSCSVVVVVAGLCCSAVLGSPFDIAVEDLIECLVAVVFVLLAATVVAAAAGL